MQTKQRIQISLPKEVLDLVERRAQEAGSPSATEAARLVQVALEIEEDRYFDALADSRAKSKILSHKQVWG